MIYWSVSAFDLWPFFLAYFPAEERDFGDISGFIVVRVYFRYYGLFRLESASLQGSYCGRTVYDFYLYVRKH